MVNIKLTKRIVTTSSMVPKDKSSKQEESTGNWVIYDHKTGNKRDYMNVSDDVHNFTLDLTWPFTQWTDEEAAIKGGGAIMIIAHQLAVTGSINADGGSSAGSGGSRNCSSRVRTSFPGCANSRAGFGKDCQRGEGYGRLEALAGLGACLRAERLLG